MPHGKETTGQLTPGRLLHNILTHSPGKAPCGPSGVSVVGPVTRTVLSEVESLLVVAKLHDCHGPICHVLALPKGTAALPDCALLGGAHGSVIGLGSIMTLCKGTASHRNRRRCVVAACKMLCDVLGEPIVL